MTTDERVEGARVFTDTRAAILFGDQTFRGRRWDSASHIQQAIFSGAATPQRTRCDVGKKM